MSWVLHGLVDHSCCAVTAWREVLEFTEVLMGSCPPRGQQARFVIGSRETVDRMGGERDPLHHLALVSSLLSQHVSVNIHTDSIVDPTSAVGPPPGPLYHGMAD